MFKKLMGAFSRLRTRRFGFTRHVAIMDDGKGASFYLRMTGTGHEWRWTYDRGLPDNLNTMIATQMIITELENGLGLPLTYPPPAPRPRPAPPSTEDLQARARSGDRLALESLWKRTGEPITDPADLVVGRYYSIGFDIALYWGDYVGVRMKGTEFENESDDNEHGHWFSFEAAESTLEPPGLGGCRFSPAEIQGEKRESGDVYYPIQEIPAPQDEVKALFDLKRAEYIKFDRESKMNQRYF